MQSKKHWEQVYTTRPATGVSWFQEHARQSVEVHRFFETVAHGLIDERVIGDLAIAADVLEARGRIGEAVARAIAGHAMRRGERAGALIEESAARVTRQSRCPLGSTSFKT